MQPNIAKGVWKEGPDVDCRLKFHNFVGCRLKFSTFDRCHKSHLMIKMQVNSVFNFVSCGSLYVSQDVHKCLLGLIIWLVFVARSDWLSAA